jgi:hypothetical protein
MASAAGADRIAWIGVRRSPVPRAKRSWYDHCRCVTLIALATRTLMRRPTRGDLCPYKEHIIL